MKIHFQTYRYLRLLTLLAVVNMAACKKFVEIDPPTTQIIGATVYSNNSSASAAMTSVYDNMIANPGLSSGYLSMGFFMGLGADELTNYSPTTIPQVQFFENALTSATNGFSNNYFWNELYNEIYVSNAVLEGVTNSTGITDPMKKQLTGEAKFMRAFLHFYATNLYGDVPLVTSTNYLVNNTISRTPQALVYQQIITDLKEAQTDLSDNFVDASGLVSTERVRPNRGAATALLARVYLYTGNNWVDAETEATKLIGNTSLYSLDSLNAVFLANSTEAIWQMEPNQPGNNTYDAQLYVSQSAPPANTAISSFLSGAFEAGDARFTNWVGSISGGGVTYYYPYKYKVWQSDLPLTEYTMVLRLGEQYLIRAEAKAQQGNLVGAIADMNVIRTRAGLSNYAGNTDRASVLAAILHERQVELFTEWGHRWFDLKRTNNLNMVMGSPGNVCTAKGGTWSPNWSLLPIPLKELQTNAHLTQNTGY